MRDDVRQHNAAYSGQRRIAVVAADAMIEWVAKRHREIFAQAANAAVIDLRVFTSLTEAIAWAKDGGVSGALASTAKKGLAVSLRVPSNSRESRIAVMRFRDDFGATSVGVGAACPSHEAGLVGA